MSTKKRENQFIDSVHKHMPPVGRGSYHMKNWNPFNGGIADVWYSGMKRDLWIEYKFVDLPVRSDTMIDIALSDLQRKWIDDRIHEGRDVMVIVGCKAGGITPDLELQKISKAGFIELLCTRKELAQRITRFING